VEETPTLEANGTEGEGEGGREGGRGRTCAGAKATGFVLGESVEGRRGVVDVGDGPVRRRRERGREGGREGVYECECRGIENIFLDENIVLYFGHLPPLPPSLPPSPTHHSLPQ